MQSKVKANGTDKYPVEALDTFYGYKLADTYKGDYIIPSGLPAPRNCNYMFFNCTSMTSCDMRGLDLSQCTGV